MSHKPVLLLDVDGVLANFLQMTLHKLYETYAYACDYTDSNWPDWSIQNVIGQENLYMLEDIWNRPGFCSEIIPYEDAWANVLGLSRDTDIYFVTSPISTNKTWMSERTAWLEQQYGPLGKRVIHTSHKYLVRGDIFVDDKPSAVAEWQQANQDGIGIVWERSYNLSQKKDYPDLLWTNDWDRVKDIVSTMTAYKRREHDREADLIVS